jgi:RNA polymerase sigma factor (sigma-70 family)
MENKLAAERRIKQITEVYVKRIYGFALRKAASLQDAEDMTQEICLKLYKALKADCDIDNVEAYVWRICHNVFANYYRSKSRSFVGVNIDDLSEFIKDGGKSPEESLIESEAQARLGAEIAYLSKVQRQIVILYYYQGKKQEEIALLLDIPKGTVKWHLFEAKAELKKGMEGMRNISELKFNPVKFGLMGLSGSVGTMGSTDRFFRSSLSQNIAYCVYREARTVNEIADILGVSPVYVECEVEFLEEYSFLIKKPGNKYVANILIDEPDERVMELQSEMYERAAKLVSNEVFDKLYESEILKSNAVYYPEADKNFLMWALSFYVLAHSDTDAVDVISFEEAAIIRKDGAQNIPYASVDDDDIVRPKYYESIKKWCGPMWNGTEDLTLWQIDTDWSNRSNDINIYQQQAQRDLKLLERFIKGDMLSADEYAYMVEKGYISGIDGKFSLSIVWIKDKETKNKLQAIGSEIKLKYKDELKQLRDKYSQYVLADTPKHLQKMRGFGLQYIFKADGWFLLYSAKEFLANGRLSLVPEGKRKSLTTLIVSE